MISNNPALLPVLLSSKTTGSANTASSAYTLIQNEWNGFALDFTSNTYAISVATAAEYLLGDSPATANRGLAFDFPSNTYAVGV